MSQPEPSQPGDLNPDDEIRRENEIMKIKLQAEFGAVFGESEKDLPPDLEQQFLQNVYQFEKAWEKQDIITVGKMLNNPVFDAFEDLDYSQRENALMSVLKQYENAHIEVDFEYDYPLEIKYRFLTEELPLHQAVMVNMPGMTLGFAYEEFHPNIAGNLEKLARKFIDGWLNRDWEICSNCLSEQLIMETGMVMKSEEVQSRLKNMFDCFEAFENSSYDISMLSYDRKETKDKLPEYALGFAEGEIEWNALVDMNESLEIQGPFKLYFEAKPDEWSIMYFVMPGWNWLDA